MLAGEVYREPAIARDASLCLRLDRDVFWDIVEDQPAIYRGILQVLSRNLAALQARLDEQERMAREPAPRESGSGS